MFNRQFPALIFRAASAVPAIAFTIAVLAAPNLLAQRSRVTAKVDNAHRVTLSGHVHPRATSDTDQGRVDPLLALPSVTLVLKPSAEVQAELDQFLASQQDPDSPDYHHWLSPEEYATRFGVSSADIEKITSWLTSQGLTITNVARARNSITFSGDAAQMEQAFRTEIHNYQVNGDSYFANATEPSMPAAFSPVVKSIHGLDNFRLNPRRIVRESSITIPQRPEYTASTSDHRLAPDDFATIYNVKPLYSAGYDGSGQKIVIVGQTQIRLSDIRQFRSYFNLPANDPQVMLVPNSRDPGIRTSDMEEADLDLEWAGAVARNATLLYVYSNNVIDAAHYAIDQNLAPVLSMSYGLCELSSSTSTALTLQTWAKQANAQGMTWIASSGDSGGADCYTGSARTGASLAVDIPASIPEVTGIGGTRFNEGSGNYWNTTNDANKASAISYIPETTWNDSTAGSPSSGGGGASVIFAKPTWQTGAGVPNDRARDVPDISLSASARHDGYVVYANGSFQVFGGTSAGAPSFAGIAALLNQRLVSRGVQATPGLGNVNPKLYSLAQTSPAVFHDVTTGDNIINITCTGRTRNCTSGSFGYSAGVAYDQATGLGSIDATQLVFSW